MNASTERSQTYKSDTNKITRIKKGPDPSELNNARDMLNNQCLKFKYTLNLDNLDQNR